MSEHSPLNHCPSPEELESLSGAGITALAEHVADCQACRARMEAYRKIDLAVRAAMEPPAALTAKIQKAIHENHAPSIPDFQRPMFWKPLAAAAAVAILAGAAFLCLPGRQSSTAPTIANSAPEAVAPPLEKEMDELRIALKHPQPPVRLAGLAASSARASLPEKSVHAPLPPYVSHVWTTRNPRGILRNLQTLNNVRNNFSVLSQEERNGVTSLHLLLQDHALQDLVDTLSEADCRLLSPSMPQPAQSEKVDFSGHNVEYTLKLVPEE